MDYGQIEGEFVLGIGNLILADEINRPPPKRQSALLEAMHECAVTIGGKPPLKQEGTYPLPEAQFDRFMVAISVRTKRNASPATRLTKCALPAHLQPGPTASIPATRPTNSRLSAFRASRRLLAESPFLTAAGSSGRGGDCHRMPDRGRDRNGLRPRRDRSCAKIAAHFCRYARGRRS